VQRHAYNFYRLRPRLARRIGSWNGMLIPIEYSNGPATDGARGCDRPRSRPPPEFFNNFDSIPIKVYMLSLN